MTHGFLTVVTAAVCAENNYVKSIVGRGTENAPVNRNVSCIKKPLM